MTVIIKPSITEKSMLAGRGGLYTFQVLLGATKSQVKQAVETAFKVKVVRVNITMRHVAGKSTGTKRLMSNASRSKYAVVRLAKGQSIELFDLKEEK